MNNFHIKISDAQMKIINEALNEAFEEQKKKRQLHQQQIFLKTTCARCGDRSRPKAPGERSGVSGDYCTDIWACEWDAWQLPCCQLCHEQFHPQYHAVCPKAQADPWGNRPHVPGGKFWTQSQQEHIEEEAEFTEIGAQTDHRQLAEQILKATHEAIKEKKLVTTDFFCSVCGRTEKPKRPVKCLECNRLMGFRKGYSKKDLKGF